MTRFEAAYLFAGILIGWLSALFLVATVQVQGPPAYQLTGTYVPSGEVHILDSAMTHLDCLKAKEQRSKGWGTDVQFACEPTANKEPQP